MSLTSIFVFQRSKYPLQIKKSEDQHQQMQNFFDKMKNSDKDLDEKFSGNLAVSVCVFTNTFEEYKKLLG